MNEYEYKKKPITTIKKQVLINNIYSSNRRIDKIDKFGAPPIARSPSFSSTLGRHGGGHTVQSRGVVQALRRK